MLHQNSLVNHISSVFVFISVTIIQICPSNLSFFTISQPNTVYSSPQLHTPVHLKSPKTKSYLVITNIQEYSSFVLTQLCRVHFPAISIDSVVVDTISVESCLATVGHFKLLQTSPFHDHFLFGLQWRPVIWLSWRHLHT